MWSTTGTSPLLQCLLTISCLDADLKDLVCRYSMRKSGNVADETAETDKFHIARLCMLFARVSYLNLNGSVSRRFISVRNNSKIL